jgi:hypothetical protein
VTFNPQDTGHAGAFIRPDGTRFIVHLGEDFSGKEGWYWSEAMKLGYSENYSDMLYVQGQNGVGPFDSCREACHAGLGILNDQG